MRKDTKKAASRAARQAEVQRLDALHDAHDALQAAACQWVLGVRGRLEELEAAARPVVAAADRAEDLIVHIDPAAARELLAALDRAWSAAANLLRVDVRQEALPDLAALSRASTEAGARQHAAGIG